MPTEPGYYWVNIPNEYGWEVLLVVRREATNKLACLRMGVSNFQDLPKLATEWKGPINADQATT